MWTPKEFPADRKHAITLDEVLAELQEARQHLPGDTPMATEGCDCVGPCGGFEVGSDYARGNPRPMIILNRRDSWSYR